MSFIGAMGVVAQQGNQVVASAPTSVSIATGIGGGTTDLSFASDDTNASNSSLTFADCTDGDQNIIIDNEGQTPYADEYGGAGGSSSYIKCYLRATGATSYSMTGSVPSQSMSNGGSVTWYGAEFTSQDGTGSTGIGYFQVAHGGGRGNIILPSHNDNFDLFVVGSATNSAGTTNATTMTADFVFKDGS